MAGVTSANPKEPNFMSTPFTMKPLGYRADGSPFWNYFGSAPEDGDSGAGSDGDGDGNEGDDGGDGDDDGDDTHLDENGLNGSGRRAIQAERQAADRAKKAYKPWGALRREFGMSPDEIRQVLAKRSKAGDSKDGSDGTDVDPEAIRREAETSAQFKVNDKLRRAAVRVVAADLLKHAADAEKFIDISEYEVDDDGDVDSAQIARDIRQLLAERPELSKVAKKGGPGGGNPDFDGGSRGGSGNGQKTMSEIIRGAVRR